MAGGQESRLSPRTGLGYQPGAEANSEASILGFRIVYAWLPVLIVVPGILLLAFFPITDEKQREMHRQLEQRAAKQKQLEAASQAEGSG